MYNARFILWPPSLSSPIRYGRERRWPRWIKKASHIGSKRLWSPHTKYVLTSLANQSKHWLRRSLCLHSANLQQPCQWFCYPPFCLLHIHTFSSFSVCTEHGNPAASSGVESTRYFVCSFAPRWSPDGNGRSRCILQCWAKCFFVDTSDGWRQRRTWWQAAHIWWTRDGLLIQPLNDLYWGMLPSRHWWGNYPGTLSCSRNCATHFKIGQPQVKFTSDQSSDELHWFNLQIVPVLTDLPLAPHMCVSELDQYFSGNGLSHLWR